MREALLQNIAENKTLWLLVLVFAALTVFMIIKANKAVKRANAQKEEFKKRLDRMKMLKENYQELTVEKIKNDDSELLTAGIAANIQFNIEKAIDMNEAFELLNDDQKTIYALSWFYDEAKTSVRTFFREYSRPLTPYVLRAVETFAPKDVQKDVKRMFDIYDDENEGVSFFEEEVAELDKRILQNLDFDEMIKNANEYIRNNAEKFV
ncbi:MAG: hypothetical protein IJU39_03905 [Clostridia bacterium]|nr:hypothetical protein [Clostridia bacterium]